MSPTTAATLPLSRRSSWRDAVLGLAFSCCLFTFGCTDSATQPSADSDTTQATSEDFDQVAERYVRLVLAVGQHDPGYVDAYYGPEDWKPMPEGEPQALSALLEEASTLRQKLTSLVFDDDMLTLRRRYLDRQLEAVAGYIDHLSGVSRSFDEESRVLYDAVAPTHDEAYFKALVADIEEVMHSEGFTTGTVGERYNAFRQNFVIPSDKLDAVFRAAIDACRERTAQFLELPVDENFVVEYVNDKPWSGYNWYQGQFQSLIQVNTDLPIFIDRAIDLACHEGYPGHHLYNSMLEKHLMRDRGWVEVSVYPLYSPQSLIAEGSANFGIDMAFPGEQRTQFEQEHLFPLAGLDAERAATYYRVQEKVAKLSYAGNEAARRYLDGEIDGEAAVDWLMAYAMMEEDRARQRLRFIETYRSYVINYNLGKDLVQQWVERQAGDDLEARWRVFGQLLSSPRLPSDLQ